MRNPFKTNFIIKYIINLNIYFYSHQRLSHLEVYQQVQSEEESYIRLQEAKG